VSDRKIDGPAFPTGNDREKGMTLRQYAAIHLKVPDSGIDWLDDMIKKSAQYGIIEYSIEETTAGDPSDAVKK
jgi:hypothetical protein